MPSASSWRATVDFPDPAGPHMKMTRGMALTVGGSPTDAAPTSEPGEFRRERVARRSRHLDVAASVEEGDLAGLTRTAVGCVGHRGPHTFFDVITLEVTATAENGCAELHDAAARKHDGGRTCR